MKLARVQLPEKDAHICRIDPMGEEGLAAGDPCLMEMAYGRDVGLVLELAPIGNQETAAADGMLVLRKAWAEELQKTEENRALARKAADAFMLSAGREKGNVRLLHARFSLDRRRLFILYTARVRVDLRRFQRQIERDYRTEMELRQANDREEAAFLGGMGACGRPCCCSGWLKQFPPVSLRMAKEQEMSLNPVAVEGVCGQLKCCLHFEYDQYRRALAGLPAHGARVSGQTAAGQTERGVVAARDVMRGILTLSTRDGRLVPVLAKTAKRIAPHGRRKTEKEQPPE